MLHVLIVDDEPIVRIALREVIPWEQKGCAIVAEASNGQEALRVLQQQRIDMVLVDMQMPKMNGLAFIQELRNRDPEGKIGVIVLSAYSKYEYVRESFLFGALDYLMKNDLEERKVSEVIDKAIAQLRERMDESVRQERETSARLQRIRETWLQQAVRHRGAWPDFMGASEELFAKWMDELEGQLQFFLALRMDRKYMLDHAAEQEQKLRFVLHTVRQVIEGSGYSVYVASMSGLELVILMAMPPMSAMASRNILYDMMNRMMSHLKHYVNVTACLGVSEPIFSGSRWREQYHKAVYLAQHRFFTGKGRLFFPELVDGALKTRNAPAAIPCSRIFSKLEHREEGWREELEAAFKKLSVYREASMEELLLPYKSFLWELERCCRSGPWNEDLLGAETFSGQSLSDKLEMMECIPDIHAWCFELLQKLAVSIQSAQSATTAPDRSSSLVERVRKWIDQHYAEPISLSAASAMVGISENYLSKIFAREWNETFIEYVMRKRVERACQLIGSGMKIYEAAELVGYPNQGHFTRVFKKVMGMTPIEYREQSDKKRERKDKIVHL
ncbi:response regulator transcription factor [Paenibacillus puerhi]|uniref:response regulator transcription factor n=1 Tax=Paenibacillus puerhi TaxID=2692622 RepID=UPI001359CCEA|nr:response regulator [Paenibacillus puerhi]